jgi:hypothetical protein
MGFDSLDNRYFLCENDEFIQMKEITIIQACGIRLYVLALYIYISNIDEAQTFDRQPLSES